MRPLSAAAARAIVARDTGEVFLCILVIEHEGMDTIRLVNDTKEVVRADGTYIPYPFQPVFPEDSDAGMPGVQLIVDNVDREVTRKLREVTGVPKCTLSVILASNPAVVEMGPIECAMLAVDYDVSQIRATLGPEEDFLNQQVPGQSYTPTNSPGMFV